MTSSHSRDDTRRLRVLLVDDEPDHLLTLGAVLRSVAAEVKMVGHPEEALQVLAQRAYDLVILDWRLGGRSGLSLLRQMKRLYPSTPVIVLTAYPSFRSRLQAMEAGASAYISKPYEPTQLRQVVRHVVEHSRPAVKRGRGVPGWGEPRY